MKMSLIKRRHGDGEIQLFFKQLLFTAQIRQVLMKNLDVRMVLPEFHKGINAQGTDCTIGKADPQLIGFWSGEIFQFFQRIVILFQRPHGKFI